MPFGKAWRKRRRIVDSSFRPNMLDVYQPVQREKIRNLVQRFMEQPDALVKNLREYVLASFDEGFNINWRQVYRICYNVYRLRL
jgi:cytochrome P450